MLYLGIALVVALLAGGHFVHHAPPVRAAHCGVNSPNNPNGVGSGTCFRLYPGDGENVQIENNRAAVEDTQ